MQKEQLKQLKEESAQDVDSSVAENSKVIKPKIKSRFKRIVSKRNIIIGLVIITVIVIEIILEIKVFKAEPKQIYDDQSLWWQHEKVHRKILQNYPTLMKIMTPDIADFEERWIRKVSEIKNQVSNLDTDQRIEKLYKISKEAFEEASTLESQWINDFQSVSSKKKKGGVFYQRYWQKENRKANLEL